MHLLGIILIVNLSLTLANAQEFGNEHQRMLELVNIERSLHGLPPLCSNIALLKSAAEHSKYMTETGNLSHDGPLEVKERPAVFGFIGDAVGECIAIAGMDSVDHAFAVFKRNRGDYDNIIGNYKYMGSAVVITPHGAYWTIHFATSLSQLPCSDGITIPPSSLSDLHIRNLGTHVYPDWNLMLELVNLRRAEHRLSPLCASAALMNSALMQSVEQAKLNDCTHDGHPPFPKRPKVFGFNTRRFSENVALTSYFNIQKVVQMWMDSPGHKANILDPNVQFFGSGIHQRDNKIFWTQHFASSLSGSDKCMSLDDPASLIAPRQLNDNMAPFQFPTDNRTKVPEILPSSNFGRFTPPPPGSVDNIKIGTPSTFQATTLLATGSPLNSPEISSSPSNALPVIPQLAALKLDEEGQCGTGGETCTTEQGLNSTDQPSDFTESSENSGPGAIKSPSPNLETTLTDASGSPNSVSTPDVGSDSKEIWHAAQNYYDNLAVDGQDAANQALSQKMSTPQVVGAIAAVVAGLAILHHAGFFGKVTRSLGRLYNWVRGNSSQSEADATEGGLKTLIAMDTVRHNLPILPDRVDRYLHLWTKSKISLAEYAGYFTQAASINNLVALRTLISMMALIVNPGELIPLKDGLPAAPAHSARVQFPSTTTNTYYNVERKTGSHFQQTQANINDPWYLQHNTKFTSFQGTPQQPFTYGELPSELDDNYFSRTPPAPAVIEKVESQPSSQNLPFNSDLFPQDSCQTSNLALPRQEALHLAKLLARPAIPAFLLYEFLLSGKQMQNPEFIQPLAAHLREQAVEYQAKVAFILIKAGVTYFIWPNDNDPTMIAFLNYYNSLVSATAATKSSHFIRSSSYEFNADLFSTFKNVAGKKFTQPTAPILRLMDIFLKNARCLVEGMHDVLLCKRAMSDFAEITQFDNSLLAKARAPRLAFINMTQIPVGTAPKGMLPALGTEASLLMVSIIKLKLSPSTLESFYPRGDAAEAVVKLASTERPTPFPPCASGNGQINLVDQRTEWKDSYLKLIEPKDRAQYVAALIHYTTGTHPDALPPILYPPNAPLQELYNLWLSEYCINSGLQIQAQMNP